jgi:hypothetical protein
MTLRTLPALASLAVLAAALLLSGMPAPVARAEGCGAGACLRVDAIPGGGIDSTASVGASFTVDIVLQGSGGIVQSFNFSLAYNPTIVQAEEPTATGLPSAALDCALSPPSSTTDQSQGGADHDPATQEASMSCFSATATDAAIGDGVIAQVAFSAIASGTSQLRLVAVAVANSDAVTLISCEVEGTTVGACTDASVTTGGGGGGTTPPPPPATGDQCLVSFAIDGETVQCADGSHVRFVGVASPLGADAGSGWATALTQWFVAGKTLTLETDVTPTDPFGSRYGYPHVIGTNGNDYNISALLIYIGMAHHLSDGVNVRNDAWFDAAQAWARAACWNMWAAGNPFAAESGCQ